MTYEYVSLPAFMDGDILSASKLNAVANNIDYVIGLDEQRNYPVEAGANIGNCGVYYRPPQAWQSGTRVEFWMLHNGDRLTWYHGTDGSGDNATLTYDVDGTPQTSTAAAFTATTLILTSRPQYKPVRIVVTGNTLFVRYLYAWSSNAPQIGSMPAFGNGGASSAADLNLVMTGASNGLQYLRQPIPCVYAHRPSPDPLARVGTRNGAYFWIRHKHPKLYFDVQITGAVSGDYAFLRYNDQTLWTATSENRLLELPVPSGLTIGNWYRIQVGYQRDEEREQGLYIYSLYEAPPTTGAIVASVDRWTHGDKANGDADTPNLYTMTTALETLGTLRWTNQPCRQAGILVNPSNCEGEDIDQMSGHRVYQWLAYENIVKRDGSRATATLYYATGTRTFSSVSLPAVTTPSFFNFDTTPCKPGMFFRVSGVKFAIQAPTPQGAVV